MTSLSSAAGARRRRTGAAILVINGALYLIAEAITALAWQRPRYSYAFNYISDLGVPEIEQYQGRTIDSPLHLVMNTGFVLHGVLFIVGWTLLRTIFSGAGTRRTVTVLAVLHGVGIAMVGFFHGSQHAVADGTAALHGIGALLAILAGNAVFIVAGIAVLLARTTGMTARRGLGSVLVAVGAAGIAAFGYLLATAGSDVDGIPERIAVYTVIASEIGAGIALLTTSISARRTLRVAAAR